jgi:hypothetical protein
MLESENFMFQLKGFAVKPNKVGKLFSYLPPYQTVRALLRHTAYQRDFK